MSAEKPKAAKKTMLNFQIDREILEKGKDLAEKRGISLSGLVRSLLIRELENESAKG